MIRVDFTDADNKYAGSVYSPEGDWTEESLNRALTLYKDMYRRGSGVDFASEETFPDFLCRTGRFYPKTSCVFHFQI